MTHTRNDLRYRQALPLELKEKLTKSRIRDLLDFAGNNGFYVSFSGGKDSEVAVDFVAKTLKELGHDTMYVLNVNTGLEYLSLQRFTKPFCEMTAKKYGIKVVLDIVHPDMVFAEVLKTYGYPIISKEVSQCIWEARKGEGSNLYQASKNKILGLKTDKNGNKSSYNCDNYRFLLDAPFRISHKCCSVVKKHPCDAYTKRTGRIPLVATTAEESRLRTSAWLRHGCNAFTGTRPHSAPFSTWTNQDMLQYIRRENLPIAEAYGKVVPENTTGIDGQLDMFADLGIESCKLCTTGCPRTGCIYCLFGITQDKERIRRLQKLEPYRADYVLRGGEFDSEGIWIPSDGLGYWFILDYLAKNGIDIPYDNAEKYRKE